MPSSTGAFIDFPWDPTARRVYSQTNVPYLATRDNFAVSFPKTPGDSFALLATCTISLASGSHRFCTNSDDGSWLYVDDNLIIDSPGIHGANSVCADIQLSEGLHNIELKYFQHGWGAALEVTMDGSLIAPNGKFPAPGYF